MSRPPSARCGFPNDDSDDPRRYRARLFRSLTAIYQERYVKPRELWPDSCGTLMGMDRSELIEELITKHLRRYVVSDPGEAETLGDEAA